MSTIPMDNDGLPLGAQQQRPSGDDDGEREHFERVCQSYQHYATFHETRQRGVERRIQQLLAPPPPTSPSGGPKILSMLPPSLVP